MNQENTDKKNSQPAAAAQPPAEQAEKDAKKNIDLKAIKKQVTKFTKAESKHAAFLGIIFVLLLYVLMVWKISGFATAEPSSDDTAIAQSKIPKIDKKAVTQILTLEQNNTQVHSLFNNARNNPFQE
jgi:hypothetical protein